MAYPILDFKSLTTAEMSAAQPLTLAPYVPTGTVPTSWDLSAFTSTSKPYAILYDTFSFTATENATYDIFSRSFFDPFLIVVYDSYGRPIAVDKEGISDYGSDFLSDFVAPYSGTMYVSAGWYQGTADSNKFVSLSIYADLDTIPKATNTLTGGNGDDRFLATKSSDLVDGGAGVDTMVYSGKRTDYDLVKSGGAWAVSSRVGNEGVDSLRNVEKLAFADSVVDTQYGDLTQALYVSYFGRAADMGGLKSFQAQLTGLRAPSTPAELAARYGQDASVKSLIDSFATSTESKALYSGDNKTFVRAIYTNLLNRDPDQGGLDFWTNAIDSGSLTRANASLSIMAGAQANTTVQGRTDALLIGNKISVATNFTFGLETEGKSGAYSGLGPAAVARDLLKSVMASTDAGAFQGNVKAAVASLPAIPVHFTPDYADHDRAAPFDAPAITLAGIDGQATAPIYA
ncbi:MAG TPA: DUF4214 domain-containing protein [Telluria sp.]